MQTAGYLRADSKNAHLQILTSKDEEGLDIMRHTLTAQVLAAALRSCGRRAACHRATIKDGFYYDIHMEQSSSRDLERLRKNAGDH